jgi:hypothetical protein
MDIVRLIFFVSGEVICLFFLVFVLTSIREKKYRPAWISFATFLILVALLYAGYFLYTPSDQVLLILLIAMFLFIILFFSRIGRSESIKIGDSTGRVDERDIIFAREGYFPGSDKHTSYYTRRPELKDIDDKIRNLPELLEPGGRYYDPIKSIQNRIRSIPRRLLPS